MLVTYIVVGGECPHVPTQSMVLLQTRPASQHSRRVRVKLMVQCENNRGLIALAKSCAQQYRIVWHQLAKVGSTIKKLASRLDICRLWAAETNVVLLQRSALAARKLFVRESETQRSYPVPSSQGLWGPTVCRQMATLSNAYVHARRPARLTHELSGSLL